MDYNKIYELAKVHHIGRCLFCDPLNESIISEDDDLRLLCDTFAIKPTHALLTTKKHYGCLGDLPEHILKKIEVILDQFSDGYIIYEHGRAGTCGVNFNSCEHFHINIIKSDIPPIDLQKCIEISKFNELIEHYQDYGEYLFWSWNGRKFIVNTQENIPPHYLRTLVAKSTGFEERSDWQESDSFAVFKENLSELKENFRDLL